MSMDPQMIQQMLMQRLQQPGAVGGPPNAAAQLANKAMLMRSLQQPPPMTLNPLAPQAGQLPSQ